MCRVKLRERVAGVCCIALALALLFLQACAAQPQGADTGNGTRELDRQELRAVILECLNGGLLVKPEEGSPELRSGDQLFVPSSEASLFDELGKAIRLEDFQVGDRLSVVYDGAIMESCPAQIAKCYKIQRVSQSGDAAQAKE